MRITRSIVPNFFTLMNLYAGFSSIVASIDHNFEKAAFFILVAAVFDMLDGVVARLLKSTSELGVELDSLCDAVSFGLAPSVMLYNIYFYQFMDLGILISSLTAMGGVYRLARFNVKIESFEDKLFFTGLPIPSAALTIISYLISFHLKNVFSPEIQDILIFSIAIIIPLVMVSTIKFDNLPRPTKKYIKQKPIIFTIFIIGFLACIFTKGFMVFPFMMFYIIASSIRYLIMIIKSKREAEDDLDESEDIEPNPYDD